MNTEQEIRNRRQALQQLIQPELNILIAACVAIEKKVGVGASVEREAAIQLATMTALGSFQNIPCGIAGWCEVMASTERASFSAVSYAHDLFLKSNLDLLLSSMMSTLTARIGVEQFELMELVQNRRMGGAA